MSLVCKFCQKDTVYVPLQVKKWTFEVHYCYDCAAEFVDHKIDYGKTVHLYTTVNDRMYRWSILEDIDGYVGHLWYIAEPGEPGIKPNRKLKLLKTFHEPPEIVPENVARKISIMLVFL
jgi:hypothetical protein